MPLECYQSKPKSTIIFNIQYIILVPPPKIYFVDPHALKSLKWKLANSIQTVFRTKFNCIITIIFVNQKLKYLCHGFIIWVVNLNKVTLHKLCLVKSFQRD